MDRDWWDRHLREVGKTFRGELATFVGNKFGIRPWPIRHYKNSGAGAIALAIHFGAARIILLGYDLQHTGGRRHWHPNHPLGLGNAGTIKEWPAQFAKLRHDHPAIEIINCTRQTALDEFPRMRLEEALQ